MTVPKQGTPEWYEWRRGGIGASELPAILGEDPFKSEFAIAAEKRGDAEPVPETEAQRWGKRVQRVALRTFAEMEGVRVRESHTTVVSRRYPHVYASLDGRIVGKREGVEVKLTKERWDDEPPRRVIIQTQTQCGVHDLDRVRVVKVGMYYSAPVVYVIERDDRLIDDLLPLGEDWYRRFVMSDDFPPVDGSAAASRFLNGIQGVPEQRASLEQAALASRLRRVRERIKALEAEDADLVNKLKASMEGAYRLVGADFSITWKPTKPPVRTDWQAVAVAYREWLTDLVDHKGPDLGAREQMEAIESLHTETGKPGRPFKPHFEEIRP